MDYLYKYFTFESFNKNRVDRSNQCDKRIGNPDYS